MEENNNLDIDNNSNNTQSGNPFTVDEPSSVFTKTRLWNLMFLIGISLSLILSFETEYYIIAWIGLILFPLLIKKKSDIIFNKKKKLFIIDKKREVDRSGKSLINLLIISGVLMTLIGFILDKYNIPDSPYITYGLMNIIFLVPTIYAMYYDFPIAIYFHKESWPSTPSKSSRRINPDDDFLSLHNMRHHPSNRHHSSNVYHR